MNERNNRKEKIEYKRKKVILNGLDTLLKITFPTFCFIILYNYYTL